LINLFGAIPWRANLLTPVAFSKGVKIIRAENKRRQQCLQIELAEEKSQSQLTEVTAVNTTNEGHEKNRYSECYKKVL